MHLASLQDAFVWAALDAEDIGKMIAVAIPILIGIGSFLLQQFQKAGPGQRPAQQRPARPQGAPAGGGGTPADEVEEFLKRVAQRRGAQPAQRAEAARPAAPAAKPVSPPPVPKQKKGRRAKQMGSEVDEHVKQTLDARKFEERAAQMTTVDRADEAMSEHVKSVFEHRIGQFETETITDEGPQASAEAVAPPSLQPSPAEGLAAALRSPEGMRRAVILGEVLRRPTHRWG